jgi:hypothetical protein
MKRLLLLLFVVLALFSSLKAQTRWHVKKTGSLSGAGTSWATACSDLQHIINQANAGDTIWVAMGTYVPVRPADDLLIIDSNNCANAFVITKDIVLLGGFPSVGNPTMADRYSQAYSTILSGCLVENKDTIYASHVLITSECNVEIDGFTITEGIADNSGGILLPSGYVNATYGGGIYNLSTNSFKLRNSTIRKNHSYDYGGGMYNEGSNIYLENVLIENNASWNKAGGGIYNMQSNCILVNTLIIYNVVHQNGIGGAIYNYADGLKKNAHCTLINVTISGNVAYSTGAVYHNSIYPLYIYNSIIYDNFKGFNQSDKTIQSNSPIKYANSIIEEITKTDNGDIDPLFLDAPNGNFRLSSCSPAINKGDNTLYEPDNVPDISPVLTDLDGNSRFYNDSIVDLGAYEYQGEPLTPQVILNNDTNICYGENIDIVFDLKGKAPWELTYTTDNGISYKKIQNITSSPYILSVKPENTITYKIVRIKDENCDIGTWDSIKITVAPKINFTNKLESEILCSGEETTPIKFGGTFNQCNWIAQGDMITGLPQDTQNIDFEKYTLTNTTQTPLKTSIHIMPKYVFKDITCYGTGQSFTITVAPEPVLINTLMDDSLCGGEKTKEIIFIGTATFFEWKNTKVSGIMGLPSGIQKGNFESYLVNNKMSNPLTAIIEVVPKYAINDVVCSGEVRNFHITVFPETEIKSATANKSIFCEDDDIELNIDAGGTNLAYQWFFNNIALTGETYNYYKQSSVQTTDKGSYSVEISGFCGNLKYSFPAIKIGSDKMLVKKWDDVILVDNSTYQYYGYQWYKNNNKIESATEQFYQETGGLKGCYYVEMILKDGSKEYSCEYCLDEVTKSLLSIYPNPVRQGNFVNVQLIDQSEAYSGLMEVRLYGSEGRILQTEQTRTGNIIMNTYDLVSGIYVLTIHTEDGQRYNEKIIVF